MRIRKTLIIGLVWLLGTPLGWGAERLHLLAGLGGGTVQYGPVEASRAPELSMEGSVHLEWTWLDLEIEARLGIQADFVRASNLATRRSTHTGWGVYGKVRVAFLYAGWGWKRLQLETFSPATPGGTVYQGWVPFQTVGVSWKLIRVSLNIEYQRTGGDLKTGGNVPPFQYSRHAGRVLVGLHL